MAVPLGLNGGCRVPEKQNNPLKVDRIINQFKYEVGTACPRNRHGQMWSAVEIVRVR